MGLANNLLLVGATFDPNNFCQGGAAACFGEASVFDLNRFVE